MHESKALRDGDVPERTFEFLHATFGDYLAARHIVDSLLDPAHEHDRQLRRRGKPDVGPLYAAFHVFSSRTIQPSIDWCSDGKTGLSVHEPHFRAAHATTTYVATIDIETCVRTAGR